MRKGRARRQERATERSRKRRRDARFGAPSAAGSARTRSRRRSVQTGATRTVAARAPASIAKRTGRKRSITAQLVRVCSVSSLQLKAAACPLLPRRQGQQQRQLVRQVRPDRRFALLEGAHFLHEPVRHLLGRQRLLAEAREDLRDMLVGQRGHERIARPLVLPRAAAAQLLAGPAHRAAERVEFARCDMPRQARARGTRHARPAARRARSGRRASARRRRARASRPPRRRRPGRSRSDAASAAGPPPGGVPAAHRRAPGSGRAAPSGCACRRRARCGSAHRPAAARAARSAAPACSCPRWPRRSGSRPRARGRARSAGTAIPAPRLRPARR